MSNNYNLNSRKIVKEWYDKSKTSLNSNKPFDNFIYLWISFNCFFISEFYDKAYEKRNESIINGNKEEEPSESNYLSVFCEDPKYIKIYSDLVQKSDSFKSSLESFKNSLQNKEFNMYSGRVADLRPNKRKRSHAKKFKDITSFKQFIFVTYQIRCNLFHGNKNPSCDNDIKIVQAIFDPFFKLLTEIYKKEAYLNEHVT